MPSPSLPLRTRVVSSYLLLMITLVASVKLNAGQLNELIDTGDGARSSDIQTTTDKPRTQSYMYNPDESDKLRLKHIRHRRRKHIEFAQNSTTKIQLNLPSEAKQSSPAKLFSANNEYLSLNGNPSNQLNETQDDSSYESEHPISPTRMMNFSRASTTEATIITTPMLEANYNLSNSTDPYAFSTETHSFALPMQVQVLMCILYGTLAFTAITSNVIVCYIVLSNQRMRTATNYFIVNLAVGDILMALLCIPFTFPANLVFQYWPFGLFLCVVVSYSQANSVFISAYTMVAISIDKYLAIMYPMRVRMTKTQSKNIILVIWLAALITSLPTAILSRLAPAVVDFSSTDSTPMDPQGQAITPMPSTAKHSANEMKKENETNPLMLAMSSFETTTTTTTTSQTGARPQIREEPFSWQNKYFCQESWTFWPKGKYFYSMTLMILQFVLPLFVLVITYSRIVVVVWGKRIPGEEDNARDARMARSKRKMIKMVILCVIAFALTWLPFNALIVIGDMRPDIWEHQSIMYIWFTTHYLAMCHTITNPLIYIWMNNRFRAGFRQVISDLCKPVVRFFGYIWFHLCCLGCLFDCSRSKYLRGVSHRERKCRASNRPLGRSVNLNNSHNDNFSSYHPTGPAATSNNNNNNNSNSNNGGHNGSGGNQRMSSNDNNARTTNSGSYYSDRKPGCAGDGFNTQTTSDGQNTIIGKNLQAASISNDGHPIGVPSASVCGEAGPMSAGSSGDIVMTGNVKSIEHSIEEDEAGSRARFGPSEAQLQSGANLEIGTSNRETHDGTPLDMQCHEIEFEEPSNTTRVVGATKSGWRSKLTQYFLWLARRELENGPNSNSATTLNHPTTTAAIDSRISSSALLMSERNPEGETHERNNNNNNNDNNNNSSSEREQRRKKKRDKQSHVISIRMTAVDYCRKPPESRGTGSSGGYACGCASGKCLQQVKKSAKDGEKESTFFQSRTSNSKRKLRTEARIPGDDSGSNDNMPEASIDKLKEKPTRTRIKTAKLSIGRFFSASGRCPSCQAELAAAKANLNSKEAIHMVSRDCSIGKLKRRLGEQGKFIIDLHQSSLSTTPTISTNQTNITSLNLSPMISTVSRANLNASSGATYGSIVASSGAAVVVQSNTRDSLGNKTCKPASSSLIESRKNCNIPRTAAPIDGRSVRSNCCLQASGGSSNINEDGAMYRERDSKNSSLSDKMALSICCDRKYNSEICLANNRKRKSLDRLQSRENLTLKREIAQSMPLVCVAPGDTKQNAMNFAEGANKVKPDEEVSMSADVVNARVSHNSDHSDQNSLGALYGMIELESGALELKDNNDNVNDTGDEMAEMEERDHYCERHQHDGFREDIRHGSNNLMIDSNGTDEDVEDELLSSHHYHRQQASNRNNVAGCGSLDLLSDQSEIAAMEASERDLVNSEADLLIEYGDCLDDIRGRGGNVIRLVRLDDTRLRSQVRRNDDNNNGKEVTPKRITTASYRLPAVNYSENNLEATQRMCHLGRLFKSTSNDLLGGQTNGRQRLATRRARYRKLQSMADMVTTSRKTMTNTDSDQNRSRKEFDCISGGRKDHEEDRMNWRAYKTNQSVSVVPIPDEIPLANKMMVGYCRPTGINRESALNSTISVLKSPDINQDEVPRSDAQVNAVKRNSLVEPKKWMRRDDFLGSEYYHHLALINSEQVKQLVENFALPASGRIVHPRDVHHGGDNGVDKIANGLINSSHWTAKSLGEDDLRHLADHNDDDADDKEGGYHGGDRNKDDEDDRSSSPAPRRSSILWLSGSEGVANETRGKQLCDNDKVTRETSASGCGSAHRGLAVGSSRCKTIIISQGPRDTASSSVSEPATDEAQKFSFINEQQQLQRQESELSSPDKRSEVIPGSASVSSSTSPSRSGNSSYYLSHTNSFNENRFANNRANGELKFSLNQSLAASGMENPVIDNMQTCRQANSTTTSGVVVVMPTAAITPAVDSNITATDEKISSLLLLSASASSSGSLLRKSPTVYLINDKLGLAKQQFSMTSTMAMTTTTTATTTTTQAAGVKGG